MNYAMQAVYVCNLVYSNASEEVVQLQLLQN